MKLESQVCSLDLAKKLKELGVKQESLWWWHLNAIDEPSEYIVANQFTLDKSGIKAHCSAFTVAELGEMLPGHISDKDSCACLEINRGDNENGKPIWGISYSTDDDELFIDASEANARAKMLIHLIEKGLVKA